MKISRRLWIVGMGLIAAIGAGAVLFANAPQERRQGNRARGTEGPVPVLAASAALADVPVYLDGVGTTKALNAVTVRAQVDGKILRFAFKEGQDVRRGDTLVELDPVIYKAQLDQVIAKKAQDQALLDNARLDLVRYIRLAQTNAMAIQQLDAQRSLVAQREAQLQADDAAIANAQAYLAYTTIRAPIDGRIGIRLVDEGNLVRASDATGIVTITQIRPITIVFSLPQQQLAQIMKASAKGTLAVDALGADNRTIVDRGTLQVVDNQIDQTTGTVKLKAGFPNAELQLWPGQFANVRMLVETLNQVVVVPTGAVQRGPNGTFAYAIREDNTVSMRAITVAQQDETRAVVTAGLQAGERVVTTGFARLSDGARITVSVPGEAERPPGANRPRERSPGDGATPPEGPRRERRARGQDSEEQPKRAQ